jgi:hypothetical protein
MTRLSDFLGQEFGEGDFVIFADQQKSLRKARVRGIKDIGNGRYNIALEIVVGIDAYKKKYSRAYFPHDFMKVEA